MEKKNFNKIPKRILNKLNQIKERYIIVGKGLLIKRIDIENGKYIHLGIKTKPSGICCEQLVIPDEKQGKYSNKNAIGYEIKRTDLPKITKYNSVEVPNFGDYYYGSHTVDLPYEAYIREFIAPKNYNIKVTCLNDDKITEEYKIIFQVDTVLDTKDSNFKNDLFFCLNLLQENIGLVDIFPSTKDLTEYVQSIKLDWEILPPGNLETTIVRILSKRKYTPKEIEIIKDRISFFDSLHPKSIIEGTSGLQRYIGALIEENLIIFENLKYGNAMYLMYEDWEILSQRSRIELLSGRFGDNFDRILHSDGWKEKAKKIIDSKRNNLGLAG